jgi:hypothetical protein
LPEGIEIDNPDRLNSIGADNRITDLNCTTSQAANNEIIKMAGSATFSAIYLFVLSPLTILYPFLIDD